MSKLVRGLHSLKSQQNACVIAIGNFDGVHLGHQQLLQQVKNKAAELNALAMAVTFEPQPQVFFQGKNALPRVTDFRQKYLALSHTLIDQVLFIRFNVHMAALSPKEFVEEILSAKLAVKHIIVGADFKFGYKRAGDVEFLKKIAPDYGFTVEVVASIEKNGSRISTTRVREALRKGDLTLAEELLGRSYCLAGQVVRGDQRGRELGYPTANIHLKKIPALAKGIYIVRLHGVGDKPFNGVASMGIRPTFEDAKFVLEVHLFDFDCDIYGKHVSVEFLKRLRDEKYFASLDLLKQQIAEDVKEAHHYFESKV